MYHVSRKISQARVFLHGHSVQLTSRRTILLFSNVLAWTVENASNQNGRWTRIDRRVFDDKRKRILLKCVSEDRASVLLNLSDLLNLATKMIYRARERVFVRLTIYIFICNCKTMHIIKV